MSNNKYYEEQQRLIDQLVSEDKFEEAHKLIDEELSMPYIPSKFESYLLSTLNKIPLDSRVDGYSISVEKIIDLLIKLDDSKNELSDVIKSLSKFNLNLEKEELEYYFAKSNNKRNRSILFELLIELGIDMDTPLGNPINSSSIMDDANYINDVNIINDKLSDHSNYIEVCVDLLKEIYLTKHIGQELEGEYAEMVIYTTGKILNEDKLINMIDDLNEVESKMKSFKSFENL